ncbi:MAG: Gfo/Idh/MocA family oxidoreductase [Rubrivivax sp.]|nr:Gfo/Idh/MocA family oxidoreductase [Rubrivivax sp.]
MPTDPSPPLRVLIIGCGNTAGGFDAERPASAPPLTHAGAYSRHGGFRLAGCVEPDAARRDAFMQRWLVERGFASIEAAAAAGPFDVVSLCSPTALHAAHIAAVLSLHPRLLFCEKPVTASADDTAAAVEVCATAGVKMAVNHSRRWAPDARRLRDELAAGHWGAVRSATGLYNKGVLHNGSHLVDLLQMLLGPLQLLAAGLPVFDHWHDDPSVPALLQSRQGVPVALNVAHAADYALFELQLLTERGMVVMEDGGAGWRLRRTVGGVRFKGAAVLDGGQRVHGEFPASMAAAVADIHHVLSCGGTPASSGETALAAQRLAEEIGCRALARAAAGAGAAAEFSHSTEPATISSAFLSTRSPATLPMPADRPRGVPVAAVPPSAPRAARTPRDSSASAVAQA